MKSVRQITIDGDVAYIPLTQDKVAIIDTADVALVGACNWYAMRQLSGIWYAGRGHNDRTLYLHRILQPPPPGMVTDHVDRNGLNCRRANLRLATKLQNTQNRKRVGITGFKGVHRRGARWCVEICIRGERQFLGIWDSPIDAARAYDRAARQHFGEFAYLNFPDEISCEPLTR